MPENLDEDLIEATIRRVAEAKARAESNDAEPEESPAVDDAAAKPILPVDESIAPEFHKAELESDEAAEADVDEDLIEATIRRVAEAKAAREDETEPQPAGDIWRDPDDEVTPAPRRLRDLWEQAPNARSIDSPPKWGEAPREQAAAVAPTGALASSAAARSVATTTDTDATLQVIIERLDVLTSLVERLVAGSQPSPFASAQQASVVDDDWDDSPQISRLPTALPRPAVFREAAAQSAASLALDAEPIEQVIDTRPLPKPLPPIQAEPKRGFDLLPRTYRLTIEDKRRGVDLVPLHRALLGMEGVRDMSLLSYNNGVAIVSIETTADLEPGVLERAVSRAMARAARVEVHNEFTMVVKLGED